MSVPAPLFQNDCHFGTVACDVATTQLSAAATTVARFMVAAMRQLYPYPATSTSVSCLVLATFLTCSVCRFLCAFMHLKPSRSLHTLLSLSSSSSAVPTHPLWPTPTTSRHFSLAANERSVASFRRLLVLFCCVSVFQLINLLYTKFSKILSVSPTAAAATAAVAASDVQVSSCGLELLIG